MASKADHFWLVGLDRWASPAEVMRLYGVSRSAPVLALQDWMDPVVLVSCLGRVVHPRDAERALRLALQLIGVGGPVQYASACSGIDLVTVALDAVLGPGGWVYRHASDNDATARQALATAYASRGACKQRRSVTRQWATCCRSG